jgi:hypothetical protein
MKKEKKKEEIQFNPADYDYMDDMPLEGWIWEFIRRGEAYRFQFKKLEDSRKEISQMKMDKVFSLLSKIREEIDVVFYGTSKPEKINPNHYLIIRIGKEGFTMCLPKPECRYIDLKGIYIDSAILAKITTQGKKLTFYSRADFHWFTDQNNQKGFLINDITLPIKEDTIYIGLSKRIQKKDIDHLYQILKKENYLKPSKVRDDKWKYYLITYDIKNRYPYKSFDDIANDLAENYPSISIKKGKKIKTVEGCEFFSGRNCENFYKSALALINGEFKKYL